jgi:hypothetical protein
MSISTYHEQIAREWASLGKDWHVTASVWDDSIRFQFESQYWQPLERGVPSYLNGLQELMQVVSQARQNVR